MVSVKVPLPAFVDVVTVNVEVVDVELGLNETVPFCGTPVTLSDTGSLKLLIGVMVTV